MNVLYKALAFLIILVIGCSDEGWDGKLGSSFHYQEGKFVVTYFEDNVGSLYFYDLKTDSAQQITFPETGGDLDPRLSRDGSRVLFKRYRKFDYSSSPDLIILELKTGEETVVLENESLLLEAVFSNNGDRIYYTKAMEFKNYSPIARKAPHDIDVYEFDIKSGRKVSLTSLSAYDIRNLRTIENNDSLIMVTLPSEKEGPVYISVLSGEVIPLVLKGTPRKPVYSWLNIFSISADSALYIAPYELYSHSFKNDTSKFLLRSPTNNHFINAYGSSKGDEIFFSTASNKFFRYTISSGKTEELGFGLVNEVKEFKRPERWNKSSE